MANTPDQQKQRNAENQRRRRAELHADPARRAAALEKLRNYARGYRERNRQAVNERKRLASKEALRLARADPLALEALRAKRREQSNRWRDKLRALPSDQPIKLRRLNPLSNEEAERRRARTNKWFQSHRVKSPTFKLSQTVRIRINDALRGKYKPYRTLDLLGCTPSELKVHLELYFEPGMTWLNHGHGKGKWTIDHVIPCASFDLNDPEEQKKCFHYSNLRPMWFEKNCAKNSIHEGQKCYHKPTSPCPPNPSPLR